MGTVNIRNIVLDMLLEINEKGKFSNLVISSALDKYAYLSHEDRAFISRSVLGTVERKITVDYIIDLFSKTPVRKMKAVIRNIIRLGVYQIMYMDSVADYAACSESVKLAEKRGFGSLKGFVNGVLRNIARNKESILFPKASENPVDYMAVVYSVPEWIVKKWLCCYGSEMTDKMLASQFDERTLSIRCNTVKIKPEELKKKLSERGIKAEINNYVPEALEISGYDSLDRIPEFDEGLFTVQDVSSMLVMRAAMLSAGDRVIDLCAAPGGKSSHAAQILWPQGFVDALDVSEPKTQLIRENAERLGLDNISVSVSDALETDEESIEKADVVIADLPCSGLGIIGKKPDIKYQASEEKCHELAKLQRQMLHTASKYVKKGGRLVYSTCTLDPEENEDNAEWFARNHDYVREDVGKLMPVGIKGIRTNGKCVEIIPGESGMDGFFISAFTRKQG